MRKNKILYSLALAFCLLILPFISACSDDGNDYQTKYVWNTTFVYKDAIDNTYNYYSLKDGVTGKTYYNLVKDEFNNNNIDLTNIKINETIVDLSACSTSDMLFSTIESKVSDIFSVTLKDKKIVFANEGENITINDQQYPITSTGNNYYDVKDSLAANYTQGYFLSVLAKVNEYDYTLNPNISLLIPNSISITFPTVSVVDDPGAAETPEGNGSLIYITYYGLFMAE